MAASDSAAWEQVAPGLTAALDRVLIDFASCKALLVLPPFAGIDRPSLGLHTLQAVAKAEGVRVGVLYANVLFARLIGEERYARFCYAPTPLLLGERCFAELAYSTRPVIPAQDFDANFRTALNLPELPSQSDFEEVKAHACAFIDLLAGRIAAAGAPIVGATTTFEQTSAAISLLNAVKRAKSSIRTIMGGANCEGEMASGLRQLTTLVDTIFSGESEETFVDYLRTFHLGTAPPPVIYGLPCENLEALPSPNFTEYYEQVAKFLPETPITSRVVWLPYESSRGCWWGQKHHCTFCGINGGGMSFREKSATRVLTELPTLLAKHPGNKVLMVDNIMPHRYFQELLPRLAKSPLKIHAFYEQKSNLSLEKVQLLADAGFVVIQPGIEALSTHLLTLMQKGVTAAQNIALLRYAKACGISVNWNLLYAFPGDHEDDYEETLALLPLISHLNPPAGGCHLSIDRFSPYFDKAADFGIQNVRPMDAYLEVLPQHVDAGKIAYHFLGDYETATRRDSSLSWKLDQKIALWRELWSVETVSPILAVQRINHGTFLMVDTRPATESSSRFRFIDERRAALALVPQRPGKCDEAGVHWALNVSKVAVMMDGHLVPLATASTEILAEFEAKYRAHRLSEIKIATASLEVD